MRGERKKTNEYGHLCCYIRTAIYPFRTQTVSKWYQIYTWHLLWTLLFPAQLFFFSSASSCFFFCFPVFVLFAAVLFMAAMANGIGCQFALNVCGKWNGFKILPVQGNIIFLSLSGSDSVALVAYHCYHRIDGERSAHANNNGRCLSEELSESWYVIQWTDHIISVRAFTVTIWAIKEKRRKNWKAFPQPPKAQSINAMFGAPLLLLYGL